MKKTPAATKTASSVVPRRTVRYGWIPDLPDPRDFSTPRRVPALPRCRPIGRPALGCPPVYDQGELGSCTANAIAGAMEFELKKEKQGSRSRPRVSSSTTTSA